MLKIENLVKKYPHKTIGPLSLDLQNEEVLAIMGPSGSGKTSFIKMLAGMISADSGLVKYNDQELSIEDIVYINQGGTLFDHLSVLENINLTYKANKAQINEVLSMLNLDESYLEKYPFELSGGERQRIDLVRAILSRAKIIIMDEVFSALDSKNKEATANILMNLKEQYKLNIILVTHDIYDALYIADQIMIIQDGSKKYIGERHELINSEVLIESTLLTERQLSILRGGIK